VKAQKPSANGKQQMTSEHLISAKAQADAADNISVLAHYARFGSSFASRFSFFFFHFSFFSFLFLLLTSYFSLLTLSSAADNPSPYAVEKMVGKKAPDFILADLDGKPVKLSDYKGKVVLLFFWASWCPTSPDEFRSLNKLYLAYNAYKERRLVVLAVSSDKTMAAAKEFTAKNRVEFPVLHDEGLLVSKRLYKAYMIPITFVIDKNGVISSKHFGQQDWTRPSAIKELESLLEKPVLSTEAGV
jgi:peroxiredoxin